MEEKIRTDLKNAQLSGDSSLVQTLRLLISEIRNTQIQKGTLLTDEEIISVVQKEIKKRKESSEMFRTGNREELAEKEEAESAQLKAYLPEQLSEDELNQIITQKIEEMGVKSLADMGKVIGAVRAQVGQKADGGTISALVKAKLG